MYDRYVKLRDSRGVTDYQVAKACGIGRTTFSEWKSGKYTPKHDKLQKIAAYFNVSIDYLMTGEENISFTPTYEEEQIIKAYRKASDSVKDVICKILDVKRDLRLSREVNVNGAV